MKKIQILIIAIMVIVFICSCGKKEMKIITAPEISKKSVSIADSILFQDNFERYTAGDVWSDSHGTRAEPSPWKISAEEDNTCWSISEESGNKFIQQTRTNGGVHVLFNSELVLKDGDISLKIKFNEYQSGDFTAAFMLRYTEGGQGYICGLHSLGNIIAWRNGPSFSSIKAVPTNYETGKWYTIRVVLKGTKIDLYVDGILSVSGTDTRIKEGNIGFFTYGASACFDDFVIKGEPTSIDEN